MKMRAASSVMVPPRELRIALLCTATPWLPALLQRMLLSKSSIAFQFAFEGTDSLHEIASGGRCFLVQY